MSSSTAIGQVSESLRNLLDSEMQEMFKVPVTVLAPDEPGTDPRINLFLYKIQNNPHLDQGDWQVRPGAETGTSNLVPPPLSLNLFYLMTPYAPNADGQGNVGAHQILGEAMRVFAEFPVVPEPYLEGDLTASREEIRIMQTGLDMEEMSRLWGTFSKPFRLSVLYEVSAVQLDLDVPARGPGVDAPSRPLSERVRKIGVPDIGASYRPPVVRRVEPTSGPPGTTLTFHGEHLDGWKAYVRLLRKEIVSKQEIAGHSFQATLPADLEAGFYNLRVDVSNLFRRNFQFEVTEVTE